jgi:hypothetical protein
VTVVGAVIAGQPRSSQIRLAMVFQTAQVSVQCDEMVHSPRGSRGVVLTE